MKQIRNRHPLYFEPVCFDHAAGLIGISPWDVSRDATLLATAHLAAIRRYRDTLYILPDLLSLPAQYLICPVETDQTAFVDAMPECSTGILRVNLNPAVFLPGRNEAAQQEMKRIRQICTLHPDLNPRCGSLIPYDADPEICMALSSQ